jgi:hypothetical protein
MNATATSSPIRAIPAGLSSAVPASIKPDGAEPVHYQAYKVGTAWFARTQPVRIFDIAHPERNMVRRFTAQEFWQRCEMLDERLALVLQAIKL